MLSTSQLVAFLATAKPDRARTFYRDALRLDLTHEDEFALVFDANGTTLRVTKVSTLRPTAYTALGWRVDNIEAEIRQLQRRGVSFERYGGFPQDELGIWTTDDGSKVAWFKDPDGHTLSLTQSAE